MSEEANSQATKDPAIVTPVLTSPKRMAKIGLELLEEAIVRNLYPNRRCTLYQLRMELDLPPKVVKEAVRHLAKNRRITRGTRAGYPNEEGHNYWLPVEQSS